MGGKGAGQYAEKPGDIPAVCFYGDMLTEKPADVVELYYNDDLSLSEIAENEGIPARGVRDSIKRAEAQLLEMEERLGLAKRFREMRDGFEAIRAAAQDIQEYNDRYGYSGRSTSGPNGF